MILEHHKEEYQHWSDSDIDDDDDDDDHGDEISSGFVSSQIQSPNNEDDDVEMQVINRNRQLKEMASQFEQETRFGPEDKDLLL